MQEKPMKVRIVCYEDVDRWILGKFALRLCNELNLMSIEADISKKPDPTADINHHIIYYDYNGEKTKNDTLMITHIDSIGKLHLLKKQLKSAEMGICMSSDTMQKMIAAGLSQEKLCYINPANDDILSIKKINIGITSKIHEDRRKNENTLVKLSKLIDPKIFRFTIMGSGWKEIIENLKKSGFEVEYYDDFDIKVYRRIVPSFDYFFYFSFDEGSMGFIDALKCGVPTIVTPQGYHLDAKDGITFPIKDFDDIVRTFNFIAENKSKLIRSVETWTWKNYTLKHVEVWEYILKNRDENYLSEKRGKFPDGISSIQIQSRKGKISKKLFMIFSLARQSIVYFINNPHSSMRFIRHRLIPVYLL
jgi:glycosyltransferase involved in cell wall biosynthesis